MEEIENAPQLPVNKPAPTQKLKQFKAPDEFKPSFGLITQEEDDIRGVVRSEDVRELLDAFGLSERKEIVFPFQHIKRAHGETWSMRVEPEASHTVDGKHVMGHLWVYKREQPEKVGQAA